MNITSHKLQASKRLYGRIRLWTGNSKIIFWTNASTIFVASLSCQFRRDIYTCKLSSTALYLCTYLYKFDASNVPQEGANLQTQGRIFANEVDLTSLPISSQSVSTSLLPMYLLSGFLHILCWSNTLGTSTVGSYVHLFRNDCNLM